MTRRTRLRRRGAVAVESAVVYGVLFVLLVGLIVGGLGVFRYQQVACQAREASRWAAVHGADWEKELDRDPTTRQQIYEQAVLPHAAGMDVTKLSADVHLIDGAGKVHDWDAVSHRPTTTTAKGQTVASRVRVTVTYVWFPEALLAGPVMLRSVSEIPMSY